jgi:hypothetical protein
MDETATPARPPTLKQLEARAAKARRERGLAWEKVMRARDALSAALGYLHDYLGHETAAFQALCAARQGRTPEPAAPPAPETLTGADEVD